jgi:uncharacterized delta-60 repeat protein
MRRALALAFVLGSALISVATACGHDGISGTPVTSPTPLDASLDVADASDAGSERTFGDDGIVLGTSDDDLEEGAKIVRQSDGKLLVLGWNISHYQLELVRFDAAGALDASFGYGGQTLVWSEAQQVPAGLAIQSDGKIVAAARGHDTHAPAVIYRFDASGKLDRAFGDAGAATVSNLTDAAGIVIASDDKVVVAGAAAIAGTPEGSEFAMCRLTASGTLDATFGTAGCVLTRFEAGADTDIAQARDVAIDPNGRLVLAGSYRRSVGGLSGAAVARYDANGTLDTSFAGTGKLVFSMDGEHPDAQVLAIQPDAKVMIGGTHGATKVFVGRFTAAGVPDPTFGTGGAFVDALGNGDYKSVVGLGIAPSGAVYASVSHDRQSEFPNGYVMRLTPGGALDADFAGGYSELPMRLTPGGMAALPDDTVVVTGGARGNTVIAKRNSDGTATHTFAVAGVRSFNMKASRDNAYAVAARPDGDLMVAGAFPPLPGGVIRRSPSGAAVLRATGIEALVYPRVLAVDPANRTVLISEDFDVSRLTAAGLTDLSFGVRGQRHVTGLGGFDRGAPTAVGIDARGRTVMVGFWSEPNGGDGTSQARFAVARLDGSGALDSSFARVGAVATVIAFPSAALSMALADGKILAAGFAATEVSHHHLALARYDDAGALDATFGDAGIVVTDALPAPFEYARAVALTRDGKIIIAGNAGSVPIALYRDEEGPRYGGTSTVLVVRYLADGSLDSTFGTGGKVLLPELGAEAYAHGVHLLPDGKIVLAGRRHAAGREDGFAIRLLPNGAVDDSYADAGTFIFSAGNSSAFLSMCARPDGTLIAAGRVHSSATGFDWALVRLPE